MSDFMSELSFFFITMIYQSIFFLSQKRPFHKEMWAWLLCKTCFNSTPSWTRFISGTLHVLLIRILKTIEGLRGYLKWRHSSEDIRNVANCIFPIGVACFSSFRWRVSREMSLLLSEKAYLNVCLLLAEVKWQWKFYVGQTKSQTSGDGKTSWQASRFPPAGLSMSMQTSKASTHLEKNL